MSTSPTSPTSLSQTRPQHPRGRHQLVAHCQPSTRRSERATGEAGGTGRVPCAVPRHPGTRRGTLQAGGSCSAVGTAARSVSPGNEGMRGRRGLVGTPGRHGGTAVGRGGWRGRGGTRGRRCHRLLPPRGLVPPSTSPPPRGSLCPGHGGAKAAAAARGPGEPAAPECGRHDRGRRSVAAATWGRSGGSDA